MDDCDDEICTPLDLGCDDEICEPFPEDVPPHEPEEEEEAGLPVWATSLIVIFGFLVTLCLIALLGWAAAKVSFSGAEVPDTAAADVGKAPPSATEVVSAAAPVMLALSADDLEEADDDEEAVVTTTVRLSVAEDELEEVDDDDDTPPEVAVTVKSGL